MSKVFVLGDSRTGTTSLHRFLQAAGFNSVHYFFEQSGVREDEFAPKDGEEDNWTLLRRFIDESGYDAFSDYPTRSYFRELMETYHDGWFILTCRKDLATWQRSMTQFMGKFGIEIDLPKLSDIHLRLNQEIRDLAAERGVKFLELNIDGSNKDNSELLSRFLDLPETVQIGRENATAAYNNRLWSERLTLFDIADGDVVSYVEKACAPNKGMLSEFGWVYLVNDSSDFMYYLYGRKAWSAAQAQKAVSTLKARHKAMKDRNIVYRKVVVPEKASVYPEFLPRVFQRFEISNGRPAQVLNSAEIPGFDYPLDVLQDAKSHGLLYFKGDSHANWLGAYFIYHHIVEQLNRELPKDRRLLPVPLSKLQPSLAGYGGDIHAQISEEQASIRKHVQRSINPKDTFELLVRYHLPENKRTAKSITVSQRLLDCLGDRPTFAFEHPNKDLPRALIFRDSTADWVIELLAEHFSESLFVWHKGQVYSDLIDEFKPDVVLHLMAERFTVEYKSFPAFAKLYVASEIRSNNVGSSGDGAPARNAGSWRDRLSGIFGRN